jgi:hypothetical protein
LPSTAASSWCTTPWNTASWKRIRDLSVVIPVIYV